MNRQTQERTNGSIIMNAVERREELSLIERAKNEEQMLNSLA